MAPTPIDRLSDRQKECLRLVWRHQSSKDIARHLGLSPHTVDDYLRKAIRTLDAADRIDAARRLHEAEVATPQSLMLQPQIVAEAAFFNAVSPPDKADAWGMAGHGQDGLGDISTGEPAPLVPLPRPQTGERNDLSATQKLARIGAMGMIWTGVAIAAAGGLAALKYLIR
ncbi:response regulator transcription factor [Sphingomonas montanisoli]|uniref:Helix-turn-helix transcriptional regulator n=1 Tax=Sphingomonas montanisoli TaxID=2606412 RepID=A0A5D9CF32_9SPHN|nr:helix-turn-helix transcriptional regulator [Sphingomonas montanisoli]TZG28731.1 helix-turn-helix transcriptional regulator [Sphingomonas montanisoli]